MKTLALELCRGLGIDLDLGGVVEVREGTDVTLTVAVAAREVERLDGRDHRTARALRHVLSAAAAARNERFHWVVRARD